MSQNYLQDPRVIDLCGLHDSQYSPSLSELWLALCQASSHEPSMHGTRGVSIPYSYDRGDDSEYFWADKYGSIEAAIAAAIVWVLERKETP